MPKKKHSLLSIEEPETPVDVVVRDSNLPSPDGKVRQYGSIVHRKATVRSILAEMEENHQTFVSKETMLYIAEELNRRMMEKFKRGCSVELLGFGTIFPTIKGSISETDTPGKIKKQFDVGFTPSENARNALKNLTVFRVRRPSVQHIIFSIVNIFKPEEKNLLEPGCIARMTGKAIKLGGEKSGIYAADILDAQHVGSANFGGYVLNLIVYSGAYTTIEANKEVFKPYLPENFVCVLAPNVGHTLCGAVNKASVGRHMQIGGRCVC